MGVGRKFLCLATPVVDKANRRRGQHMGDAGTIAATGRCCSSVVHSGQWRLQHGPCRQMSQHDTYGLGTQAISVALRSTFGDLE
jgi:hypothetical protein